MIESDMNDYNHVFDLLETVTVCKSTNSEQHIELYH